MPFDNAFQHQRYLDVAPDLWEIVPNDEISIADPDREERMRVAGRQFADAGVRVIYLVHGTMTGTDASGALGGLGRIWPEWSHDLKQQGKRLVDSVMGTNANYDDTFVTSLRDGLNAHLEDHETIDVRRFIWSSQNHGLGRAEAAIGLFSELADLRLEPVNGDAQKPRVLLWGHSHAGNVFALLSNLLGGSLQTRARFFRAARPYYRKSGSGRIDIPIWHDVRKKLAVQGNPLETMELDIVTFGTPIRYGWETGGYSRLMHFNNHIVTEGIPSHKVPFPPSLDQINAASAGDFVQQFFIAGTNFPPTVFAYRSWRAERRLIRLIQKGHRARDLWDRLKRGIRVADEGRTLLVDYSQGDVESAELLAGHAVYTKRRWLPFHVKRIADEFYT